MKENPYLGRWRIIEMEQWDQDYIDMETEGYFHFGEDGCGYFQFGLVQGEIDYKIVGSGGKKSKIEFSWDGRDENDPASGRGKAIVKDGLLEGTIYFQEGDESWFKAENSK